MSGEFLTREAVCRRAMKVAVSAICSDSGYTSAEESSLETLMEIAISFLTELGRSARAFSELSCRTDVMTSDVALALIEMGQRIEEIPVYAKNTKQSVFLPPGHAPNQPQLKILQVGDKLPHPSHIPDYLPSFPDPHTYITTTTHKAPATEYQLVREKAASQKRDVERALTRFIAKTGETESLFQDDPYAFPLIANHPKPLPYLECLLPKDEDLQEEEQRLPEAPPNAEAPPLPPPQAPPSTPKADAEKSNPSLNDSKNENSQNPNESPTENDNQIDNPYLRAIAMPKLKGGKKGHRW